MPNPQPTVTRTYRAAIRLGEDYITLEETITLPLDASDDEVQQAVDLGWRIYSAQREAVAHQATQLRTDAPPPAPPTKPASDKQRAFIDTLAREAGWDGDALTAFAGDHGVSDWETMSAAQAAALIDAIKAHKAAEQEQPRATAEAKRQQTPQPQPHRSPAPAKLAEARQVLAQAEQRTGVAPARPELPPVGDRIRNPDEPATESQIAKIIRGVTHLGDADLQRIAPQIAAVLGYERVALKGLRDKASWPYLRDDVEEKHRLTKGRASQIIGVLDSATAEKAAA